MRLKGHVTDLGITVRAFAVMVLLLTPQALSAKTAEATSAAIRGAIEELLPDSFSDYVWTFIRRGDNVKIKGKGDDKVDAYYKFSEDADGNPVLTLMMVEVKNPDGTRVLTLYQPNGDEEVIENGPNANSYAQFCDADDVCRIMHKSANGNKYAGKMNRGNRGKSGSRGRGR